MIKTFFVAIIIAFLAVLGAGLGALAFVATELMLGGMPL